MTKAHAKHLREQLTARGYYIRWEAFGGHKPWRITLGPKQVNLRPDGTPMADQDDLRGPSQGKCWGLPYVFTSAMEASMFILKLEKS